ncbi:MAG: metallophosphoesterase [Aliihoeflea sp.]
MANGVHFEEAAAPDGMRLYAVGDVHGRADLLRRVHDRIDAEIAQDRPDDWRVVHLGDYVDRGEDSCGVIDLLVQRMEQDPRHIALLGNHEERFAMFLEDAAEWTNFINFGGRETALSYGVDLDAHGEEAAAQQALAAAVPKDHVLFLDRLQLSATFGDFFFCHAGIRPGVPLDRQTQADLVWIRKPFHDHKDLHPKVIVHGHTPVAVADIRSNRVNLDTLAYDSGILTVLVVDGTDKRLFATEEG